MQLPLGYKVAGSHKVCKLRKSLYGLKQASRQWNHKFANVMLATSYRQSQYDHSLFIRHDGHSITLLVVYVDDIIITGDSLDAIAELKRFLHSKLEIREFGPLKYFLGVEIARSTVGIFLN